MGKQKVPTTGGLRKKLFLLSTMMVIIASVAFAVIGIVQLRTSMRVAAEMNESQNTAVKEQSRETMTDLIYEDMLKTVAITAEVMDEEFWIMYEEFALLAAQVLEVFKYPDRFDEWEFNPPDPANAGQFALQLIVADPQVTEDPETMEMLGKLASLEPMMEEIVRGSNESIRDCYISLPIGASLAMDTVSNEKFDENGEIYLYDPTTRPWYTGAVEAGEFCFTFAVNSFYLGLPEIQYGYPIYLDGELKAVLQGSTQLSVLQDSLTNVGVGQEGFTIMVSDEGQLIYSPKDSGDLEMVVDMSSDIRETDNEDLAALINEALGGDYGLAEVVIDDEPCYAAYAKMDTLGWTIITFVPQKVLDQSTDILLEKMDEISARADEQYKRNFTRSTLLILGVVALLIINAFLAAVSFSGKIANPINLMTKQIEEFTGDQFTFEMNDAYKTGDEIEILANTFGKLSEQMEEYLRNILSMTAEKERVSTELALAARIQADMLPNKFPAFPDRQEFNIYASMTPAKEVGGDFYDFFLVDEDHLALLMADVSGKGVPAAMFMMMAKNVLQTQAMTGHSPQEVLNAANKLICESNRERMFVTVWFAILELSTGLLTAANAGHEYPILKNPDGDFEIFKDKHGFVLGGMARVKYKEYELQMKPGSKLFVYTDGLAEAMNADQELFGLDRTLQALNATEDESPEGILKSVDRAVSDFVGEAEQFDDLTMLCIEYRGRET